MMIDAFSMNQHLLNIMQKIKVNEEDYQILSHFQIIIMGMGLITQSRFRKKLGIVFVVLYHMKKFRNDEYSKIIT